MAPWNSLAAILLMAVVNTPPANGASCKYLARTAENRLVSVDQSGATIATFAKGEEGDWYAAWSPSGKRVLYSRLPSRYGEPVFVHLADTKGEYLGVLRVTATEPRDSDIEWTGKPRWLGETRFWYSARVGHQAGYVDVWEIDPADFAASRLKSRLLVGGDSCIPSPDFGVIACVAEDWMASAIVLYDYTRAVGGDPPPDAPPDFAHAHSYEFAPGPQASKGSADVEGSLSWISPGELAFAIRAYGSYDLKVATLVQHGSDLKSWVFRQSEVTGVEGRVQGVRAGKDGLEVVTDRGIYAIQEQTKPKDHQPARLIATQVAPAPGGYPAALKKLWVLDRWCGNQQEQPTARQPGGASSN